MKYPTHKFLFFLACSSLLLNTRIYSAEPAIPEIFAPQLAAEEKYVPWFTGTLLSISGAVLTKDNYNIEPYLFVTTRTGAYDSEWKGHSKPNFQIINAWFFTEIGLNEFMDIELLPQVLYQSTRGHSFFGFGDFLATLGFQILTADTNKWKLDMKAFVDELFPTGKYQKLNPKKLATDAIGGGSFVTSPGFSIGRLFEFSRHHFLTTRLNFTYSYFAPVHVRGFNTYGGGFRTHGKVFPGSAFVGLVGFEYSLTRNWVLAMDILNIYQNKTRFSGRVGHDAAGIPSVNKRPSLDQLSLTPSVEYNFNQNFGIIAGSWLTVKGRNTPRFISGVIAVNYYFSTKKSALPSANPKPAIETTKISKSFKSKRPQWHAGL